MRLGIIIINDIGIQIALDEDHILNSPGYAVVHEESIFLGEDGRPDLGPYRSGQITDSGAS